MIVSRQNRHLKDIRRLKASKAGRRALLEGPHLIAEALAAGLTLQPVLATPDFLATPAGRRLGATLPRPPLEVDARLLAEIADTDSPRGIVAVTELARPAAAELERELPQVDLGVFVERLQDPGNLGALARAAEAAGAGALVLSPATAHPNHPRALRGSAGSLLRLPTFVDTSLPQLKTAVAARGEAARFAALLPRGGIELYQLPNDRAIWLVVGAEGSGLSPESRTACDLEVTIPLAPPVESLNAAVAAAVALFEIRRQKR